MILNIILILLLLHTVFYFFSRNKSTIISCGLFGYIGEKNNHSFSWDKFNYLGRDNDERGGDSIGRMVGDDIVKFINTKKAKTTYEDFVINYKNSEESHIALGHTRKASVGGISENTAQPICLDIPTGEGKFTMVHNGTISNWRDLAIKYNINTEGKSDSIVLAEIIMENGYDVLTEYIGAAAIIIKDDRTPDTLFVFKGESKIHNRLSEERPLYYYKENENSMYISSKEEGLYFIGGDVDDVFDFNTNTLYEIYEGMIVSETIYDRKEKYQIAPTVYVSTINHNISSTLSTRSRSYDMGDCYSGFQENYQYCSPRNVNNDVLVAPNPWSRVVVGRLRYWKYDNMKFEKLNGIYHITEDGLIRHAPSYTKTEKTKVYYFYCGVMMRDKDCYDKVKKELPKAKHFKESWRNTGVLAKYSSHPICTIEQNQSAQDVRWIGEKSDSEMYTGTVTMLFGSIKYTFKNGDVESKEFLLTPRFAHHSKNIMTVDPVEVYNKEDEETQEIEDTTKSSETSTGNPLLDAMIDGFNESKDDEEEVDNDILTEIDKCISLILVALDSSRNEIELTQTDAKIARIVVSNLNKLEDMLQEDKIFKTKNIKIQYEK